MPGFKAKIQIIGINPFVLLPGKVLKKVFQEAGKEKGKIPVRIKIDGHEFIQTLIKYSGHWRLYLNTPMRKAAKKEVGDTAVFHVAYDPVVRIILPHPKFVKALKANPKANRIFDQLRPSLKLEIVRYLSSLKTEASVDRNVIKAINFLEGKSRFVGREGLQGR